MPADVQQTISRIESKTRIVLDRYALAMSQRNEARAEIARLTAEISAAKARIQALENENNYLKMASVLAPNRSDSDATRALLTDLLRKIDRCILDLND